MKTITLREHNAKITNLLIRQSLKEDLISLALEGLAKNIEKITADNSLVCEVNEIIAALKL